MVTVLGSHLSKTASLYCLAFCVGCVIEALLSVLFSVQVCWALHFLQSFPLLHPGGRHWGMWLRVGCP